MNNDNRSYRTIIRTAGAMACAAFLAVTGTIPAQATPGTKGTPVVVFEERFENAGSPVHLDDYMGPQEWVRPKYTADKQWLPVGGGCNGWVAGPGDSPHPSCSTGQAWEKFGALAWALGKVQGMSHDEAESNHAVSSLTNRPDQTQEAGLILRTRKNAAKGTAGRFYAASAFVAATGCDTPESTPNLTLSLLVNGRPVALGSNLTSCDATPHTKDGYEVWAKQLVSSALLLEKNDYLGMQMENMTATGLGNDGAYDLIHILDVTPQLDQSFTPSRSRTGTNLTYTITNTRDLRAKQGWSFSAQLPSWAKVSGQPTTTCEAVVSTDGAVAVRGNLRDGEGSCTVTVPVEITETGQTLTPDSIESIKGLDMPSPAPVTVPGPGTPETPAPEVPGPGSAVSPDKPKPEEPGAGQPSSSDQVKPVAKPARDPGNGVPQIQTGGSTAHGSRANGLAVGCSLAGIGAWVILQRRVFAQ